MHGPYLHIIEEHIIYSSAALCWDFFYQARCTSWNVRPNYLYIFTSYGSTFNGDNFKYIFNTSLKLNNNIYKGSKIDQIHSIKSL